MTVTMSLEEFFDLKAKADRCAEAEKNTEWHVDKWAKTNDERLEWLNRFVRLESWAMSQGLSMDQIWNISEGRKPDGSFYDDCAVD